MVRAGGCLCGQIRYEAEGEPVAVVTCHCRWCQRISGGSFLTFVGFDPQNVTWQNDKPTIYQSSEAVHRGFCPTCGSTVSFARPAHNVVALMAGCLDEPDSMTPQMHCFADHQNAWLKLEDGIPSHGRFPPEWGDRETD
ncbi:MAG: GFA family protein [Gammaproteobacteria bacterium]|nr:GFA family protein [Gammaproteobacteria bacterium]